MNRNTSRHHFDLTVENRKKYCVPIIKKTSVLTRSIPKLKVAVATSVVINQDTNQFI